MMKNQLVGHHNNNINDDTSESSNRPMMIGVSVDEEYHFSFENNQQHIPTSNVDDLVDRFSSGGSCRSPGIVGEHENVQKKAFTKWLNSHLSKKNHPLIVDLYTDLRDGTILIALLDVLYECSIKLERGRLRVHHLNNVARVLQVLNERQVKLVNICTNDIVDGNAKLTLGLVWCIILHWQVNHILRHTTGKFSELLLVSDNGNGARQTTATESNRIVSNLSIPSRIPIVPVPSTSAKQSLINQTSAKGNLVQSSATMSANDLERTLLSWCQSSTANYEGVNIKNFTNSWVDGLAFNALIHHYRPNLFNYGQVLAMDSPQMRLQHAFDVASKHLNIEKLLDPEDLNTPRPDKKSVIVYVMCLFQKFNGSHSEQSTSKVASPSSKNHTKTQVQPSNIPILSSTYSQNKRSIPSPSSASKKSKSLEKSPKVHQSSSNNSSTVLIDPKLHEEYSNEIEEILIWIFSAEDKLSTAAESDSRRFESTTGDNGSSNLDQSITTELRHNRVMTTIEAAEYAKTRFELHEEYMRELAVYYGKITKTFEKGQLLLGSTDHFEQNNKNNKNRPKSQENELRKEIAIQMKLLDDRFNQLRDRANDLQMFLQQKLVEAQNSQLEELRRLMTQTEERIAVIIPERYNDMPSTPSVLDSQLIEFDQLQQAIIAEQNLLKLISKFVIIDAVDESGTSTLKETNFMDQLDALNERWANACQIIERRGLFLKELKQFWDDYCSEEQRLQEWFNRLERRLTGMEETIDEVDDQLIDSSSRQSIEQKKRFLEDILKRLDRMCVEIMVGIEHSQKMHALKYDEDKDEDEDEDDNENKTPLSKFNNVVRRLLGLGENGMCSNVQKSIVSISIRWETMIGRIDHAKSITNRRLDMLNQLIKQTPIEDSFHQSTKPNKTMADILTTFHDNKSLSKWINSIETIVNQLQIMENLKNNISSYSGEPLKTINEIESFEMKSFTNITECLTYYDELCQQRASIYPTFIIDDKQRLSSEIVQNELKQLSSMIEKLKKLEHDFTDIRKQSKMFINNLNNANEEIQLKSVLKEIEKRFNDLRPILKRCHQYIETLSELKSLEEKFFIIKRQLDLNYKKLMEIINIIDHDHSLVENIQEQIEQFTNSINEQQSTILHLNETIIRLQKNSPELFFCWPEDVKEWKRLKLNSHSKFCTFQLNCFQLSTEMKMNIDLFITLFNAEKLIGKHLDDIRKEIAEESKQKSMDDDDDGDGEPKSPTNKLQAAIDALKNWLLGVMQVVEVYEDDDDIDSDDQEPNDNNMDSITTATTTINNDDQMNRSIKVPGSRLRSFSDLANAIDNRIEVLMELHNTVSNEQCNYEFACRRTTELYFGISNSTDETDLNTIEHRLRDITETELGERSQSDRILIESIQQLIERWHHVSDQFNTLLEKLESISPSTMVLEAEYAGIARWIEDATTFLDEAITVGDLETLSEQLCECERLKEYMEQSVEKTFQPLLETAKEAVRVLFGTKNQLSVQVPIVSEIENVWNDLSERINHKLDRLRLAHELTRRLNQTLNEHQDWLRSFESEMNSPQYRDVNQAEFEQLFKEFMNSNVIDDDDECSRYNWRSAFPPMSMLDRLQSRRSSYLRTVLEPPDSLISQMLSFQTTGHSSLAFDKQKKHAKIELVRAFDSLETKLKCRIETIMGHVQNLIQFVRLIGEEMSLLERFQVVSDDVQEKMVSIETIEQSELLIHDLELMLSESVSSNRQNRLNSIQTLLASDSNLFQFLIDSGQQMIVEQQQQQVQHILTHDSRLRSTAEKNLDSLEQYCRQYKQYEERIQLIHQWLQDYRHDDPNALAAKRAELGRLETECDQVMSPKTSINRLVHCRIEFLRKIFNEFERQKVAPNEQPSPTTNEYVSRLEQELADLGTSINELEINFDDDELQALITSGADVETILQWLPSFLQRIIYEDCVRYEQRLQTFHRQLPNDGGQRTKRIDKLYETHGALTKALQYRKTLLIELIDLCNQINRKLVQLETEGSKILVNQQQQQQQQSPESIGNIKRKCILILNEICQLKEQLDIHCIRQSDVLIGIEEIGSKYDEIITEIAERYLDDVDEEEDDEGENGGNDESSVAVERIRPNLSNNVTGSAAKHLSTINEESGIVVPAQSQKMEQDSSNVEQHLSINNKQIEMVSMMQNNKNDDDELSYSIKPYLNELNQLERRIISICSVTTIECTNRPSSNKKLSISLVEDELHRLNKSLNEVRTPYESALCCAAIFGLINSSKRKSSKNLPDDGIEHESSIEETNDERSPTQSQQLISMLGTLQTEFGISWNRFLSLHRHWWLVRDATLQFNSEFRKLSDWFENVELQLINGRWTTIVIDDNEPYGCFNFDVTDLNLSIIARTQLLLITQLKSHIPIYGKIQVLYRRLSQCFTPDEPDPNGEDHIRSAEDRKALLDARGHIQKRMSTIDCRWMKIVRELTWRRECLLALASGKLVANVSGYPYRRGKDPDFDKVLDDFVRQQSDRPNEWFQLEQLRRWIDDTRNCLVHIRSEYIVSDMESSMKLYSRLNSLQVELSHHYLHWMAVTQQPFIDGRTTSSVLRYHLTDMNEIEELDRSFVQVTAHLYNMCYFTQMYMTCFAYVQQLTNSEIEWIVTAIEHLNMIEDYQKLDDNQTELEFPLESITFVESLKNTLITHENNIEQITTIVTELTQHANEMEIQLNLSEFMSEFDQLTLLRQHLTNRLRVSGQTVCAAFHHLLKQAHNRLYSLRNIRECINQQQQQHVQQQQQHHSHQQSPILSGNQTGSLRSHQSTHSRRTIDQNSLSINGHEAMNQRKLHLTIIDLRSYYETALPQFDRWLALECFIISYYCAQCFPIENQQHQQSNISTRTKSTNQPMKPSRLLKLTIRRIEVGDLFFRI
ncbi:hypothetical protein BLOT_010446 [Blomia tropicalis]|nr:hypothetical protein BLOT_010446 [Blomia tropicalis]